MNNDEIREIHVDIDPSTFDTLNNLDSSSSQSPEEKKPKKRRKTYPFIGGLLLGILGLLVVEVVILFHSSNGIDLFSLLVKSKQIESLVDENYLYNADKYLMQENMYLGMLYGLTDDDYAEYYTADNYDQLVIRTQGSYVGIGVNVTQDPDGRGIYVASVTEEGPAAEAGVLAGDIITAVDSQSLVGLSSSEAVSMITGEEGTTVDLTILRDDETIELSVERRTVVSVSVHSRILTNEETGRRKVKRAYIGYISINTFNMQTGHEFSLALENLMGEGQAAGIIIDLRNNGGGELTTCLSMLDRVLRDDLTPVRESDEKEDRDMTDNDPAQKTLLLQIESKNAIDRVYRAEDGVGVDIPIVVLVNESSASASEVFSGALRDYGYKIIGTKTYGKGIVQTTFTLYDDTAVKFTTHQYRLPGGELIHGKGIEPDISVEFEAYDDYVTSGTVNYADGAEQPDIGEDKQVAAAISELDEEIYEAYQLQ